MNMKSLGALICLNLVLLIALVVAALTPQPAPAQGHGRPGEYAMIAGEVSGLENQQAVVYIIETKSSQVVALVFNSANNTLTPLDRRVILDDLQRPGSSR